MRRAADRHCVPHKYVLMAIDRKTGKTIWERVAREEAPHEASHPENGTWASPSAIVDGEHIIASFESRGYYAYDMNGTLVWQKDLGDKKMRNTFGEGSTPGALRQHAGDRLGSHRRIIRRRARQAKRQRTLAQTAQRDRHVGDAAHHDRRAASRR